MKLGAIAQRARLPLGFVLAALYVAFARPEPRMLALGVALALAGVCIRAWASGHIAKNERLATTGPYAYTRNPLYFGSFLIAAGFAIAAHWLVLVGVIVFFLLVYGPTMRWERDRIRRAFPEEFADFERHVPAFFPRVLPWRPQPADAVFSVALYMRHGEWKVAVGYLCAVAWLLFRVHWAA